MSTIRTTYDDPALAGKTIERDARALLGQVMGFVAVTVGFAALGAYLGRDLSGATGLWLFIPAFAFIFGLNSAAAKGREVPASSSSVPTENDVSGPIVSPPWPPRSRRRGSRRR